MDSLTRRSGAEECLNSPSSASYQALCRSWILGPADDLWLQCMRRSFNACDDLWLKCVAAPMHAMIVARMYRVEGAELVLTRRSDTSNFQPSARISFDLGCWCSTQRNIDWIIEALSNGLSGESCVTLTREDCGYPPIYLAF